MKRLIWLVVIVYIGLAVLANWLAAKFNGPNAVPVGFGLTAPGGVYAIGAVLVLRDWLNQVAPKVSLAVIPVASIISYAIGELAGWTSLQKIALASVAAFICSELVEWAIFAPIRKRQFTLGVALSASVGILLDSFVFLTLAFGSLAYFNGQVVGKGEALAVGILATLIFRRAFPKLWQVQPA